VRLPSRAYVGVVVFGLITVAATISYTVLVLQDVEPSLNSPYAQLFPEPDRSLGMKVFLVLASMFSLALFWAGWRALLTASRRDAKRRRAHEELRRQVREYQEQLDESRPAADAPMRPRGPN
jgi:hypothetical protein